MSNRILIVDDEKHIRRMIRLTLEAAGYDVGEAQDGFEGLKLYGDGSDWDVVILDQRMPGIDGLETLRRMKESDPRARVVMATAYASVELAVEAMKIGASDFVRKPLTPEILRNAVAAAIAKRAVIYEQKSSGRRDVSKPPSIETITMNGFTILDPATDEWHPPEQRRFVVLNPTGSKHEVVVEIEDELLNYVERMIHKTVPLESSFWTSQARRLLGDYLWNEGEVPKMKILKLKEIDRKDLLSAERWTDN